MKRHETLKHNHMWWVALLMATISSPTMFADEVSVKSERLWNSLSGGKVAATFIELKGQAVSLRTGDGRIIQIDLPALSSDDRRFLERAELVPPKLQLRTWTSKSGKSLDASLHSVEGDDVTLTKEQSKVHVRLSDLSEADQAFVRDIQAAERAGMLQLPCGQLKEGRQVTLTVPVPAWVRKGVSEGLYGNISLGPEILMSIALPDEFDPGKPQRIIIISAPGDGRSVQSVNSFWKTGIEHGWIVIACSPLSGPDGDTLCRWAMLQAGLDVLQQAWPESKKWPVAAGGNSGGAKVSGRIGVLLAKNDYDLIGIFKGGCNQQYIGSAIDEYKPDKGRLLKAPVYLSSGLSDTVATPRMFATVEGQLKDLGFKQVRLENYDGEHSVNQEQIGMALDWFSKLAGLD